MLGPLPRQRWDFKTAAHLLNRAGFGGPPAEIEKLVALGPEQAVSSFVDYESVPDPWIPPDWAKPDPEKFERLRAARMAATPEERQQLQREEQRNVQQHML